MRALPYLFWKLNKTSFSFLLTKLLATSVNAAMVNGKQFFSLVKIDSSQTMLIKLEIKVKNKSVPGNSSTTHLSKYYAGYPAAPGRNKTVKP